MKQARTRLSTLRFFRHQDGMTLFIALVALIAMALVGVALVRTVETTSLISGNFAFRNAALQASDLGVEKAFARLQVLASGSLDAKYPSGCTTGCNYYPTMQALDAQGIPGIIDWSTVTSDTVTANGDYTVRYVIDRLCSGTLPITDLTKNCYSGTTIGGGTKKTGGIVFSSTSELYFRVTVRVDGPRNTVSYVQTVLAH